MQLQRGYASFHHPLTMHGSYENVSDRSRRAIVLNAMSDQTLGNTAGYERLDALKSFPAMDQDQVLNSNFFPLLFDGDKELEGMGARIPKVDQAAQDARGFMWFGMRDGRNRYVDTIKMHRQS